MLVNTIDPGTRISKPGLSVGLVVGGGVGFGYKMKRYRSLLLEILKMVTMIQCEKWALTVSFVGAGVVGLVVGGGIVGALVGFVEGLVVGSAVVGLVDGALVGSYIMMYMKKMIKK